MTRLVHPTADAKWWANTRPAGQHLTWTGRVSNNGSPIFDYRGRRHQAMRIAHRIRTGREPEGPVQRTCRTPLCVAPTCMEDARDRRILRTQLRALDGLTTTTDGTCDRRHNKAEHGRIATNGTPYCNACAVETKRARQGAAA
jgi:hypothetical protein